MSVYSDHKPGSTEGLYLKLRDGDRVKLRLVSEPAISVFKEGDRPRYSWVVINHETKKPQVYSAGVSVFSQIADLEEEWGPPTDFDVIIKRTGAGLNDTSYSVAPVKQSTEPTPEQLTEAEKIDLPQAIKGKWLAKYVEDHILPDPVTSGASYVPQNPPDEPLPDDETIDLDMFDDIPPEGK